MTAAPESSGTANDGVVFVNHGNTYADYFTLGEGDRNRRSVNLADAFVNFATVITSYSIHYTKLYEKANEYIRNLDWYKANQKKIIKDWNMPDYNW